MADKEIKQSRIPPLVWILVVIMVVWIGMMIFNRDRTYVSPRGVTMPAHTAEGAALAPEAPPIERRDDPRVAERSAPRPASPEEVVRLLPPEDQTAPAFAPPVTDERRREDVPGRR